MARSICPSCGEPFNGKKCKNCEYEAFGDIGNPELHGRREASPVWETPKQPHACAPGQIHTHTRSHSRTPEREPFGDTSRWEKRKQWKKPPAQLGIILILLLAWPVLNLLGFIAVGIVGTVNSISSGSHSSFAAPQLEAAIPEGAELIYADGDYSIWAAWEDALDSGAIPVVAENHTNQNVNITVQEVVLQGNYLSGESFLYIEAPKESKAEGTLYLEDAAAIGIGQLSHVSFRLHVFDNKTYDTVLDSGAITLDAGNGTEPTPVPEPDGTPVVEAENIRVYYLGLDARPEDFTGSSLRFCVVNDTNQHLDFYTESAQANGAETNLPMWCELPPHTLTYTSIYLYGLEDLGISQKSEVESIWMHLQVYDESETYGEYGTIDLEPFTITLDG